MALDEVDVAGDLGLVRAVFLTVHPHHGLHDGLVGVLGVEVSDLIHHVEPGIVLGVVGGDGDLLAVGEHCHLGAVLGVAAGDDEGVVACLHVVGVVVAVEADHVGEGNGDAALALDFSGDVEGVGGSFGVFCHGNGAHGHVDGGYFAVVFGSEGESVEPDDVGTLHPYFNLIGVLERSAVGGSEVGADLAFLHHKILASFPEVGKRADGALTWGIYVVAVGGLDAVELDSHVVVVDAGSHHVGGSAAHAGEVGREHVAGYGEGHVGEIVLVAFNLDGAEREGNGIGGESGAEVAGECERSDTFLVAGGPVRLEDSGELVGNEAHGGLAELIIEHERAVAVVERTAFVGETGDGDGDVGAFGCVGVIHGLHCGLVADLQEVVGRGCDNLFRGAVTFKSATADLAYLCVEKDVDVGVAVGDREHTAFSGRYALEVECG